jgi:hypothetical protein
MLPAILSSWKPQILRKTIQARRRATRRRLAFETLEPRLALTFTLGPEQLVNTTVQNPQYQPSSASSPVGSVVVWTSWSPGTSNDVFGQRFDVTGHRVGPEFQVAAGIPSESAPAVAMSPLGGFVVTWVLTVDLAGHHEVQATRYSAAGTRVSPIFTLASLGQNAAEPKVAMSPEGDYVITCTDVYGTESSSVFAEQFRFDDTPIRTYAIEFGNVSRYAEHPSVAYEGLEGRFFAVAYQSLVKGFDGQWGDVRLVKIAAATGSSSSYTIASLGDDQNPSVAIDYNFDIIVVWQHMNVDINTGAHWVLKSRELYLGSILQPTNNLIYGNNLIDPTIVFDPTTRRELVTFTNSLFLGISIAEVDTAGYVWVLGTVTGSTGWAPSISSGAAGHFVVAYAAIEPGTSDVNIHARFGTP